MRTPSCLIVSTLFFIGARAAPTQSISTHHSLKEHVQARQFHTADFVSSAPNIATPARELNDSYPHHGVRSNTITDNPKAVSDKARAVAKRSTRKGSIDLGARKDDDFRISRLGHKAHNNKTNTQGDEKRLDVPTQTA